MRLLSSLLLALLCTTHLTAQAPVNTTQRIYLSGTDAEHTRTWDFYCSGGQQSGKWRTIEQLGPQSQPDNIRIKSGDEGFHIRLVFDFTD